MSLRTCESHDDAVVVWDDRYLRGCPVCEAVDSKDGEIARLKDQVAGLETDLEKAEANQEEGQ